MSRRRLAFLTPAVATAIGLAACGSTASATGSSSGGSKTSASSGYGGGYGSSSGSSNSVSAAGTTTVRLATTSKGKILVNAKGFTLYLFTADRRNVDRCLKTTGCLSVWPALTVSGRPTAGAGVRKTLLGTITLPGGHHQVTYAGHPLYRYSGDRGPHNTSYIGATSFGGTWLGVNSSGKAVH